MDTQSCRVQLQLPSPVGAGDVLGGCRWQVRETGPLLAGAGRASLLEGTALHGLKSAAFHPLLGKASLDVDSQPATALSPNPSAWGSHCRGVAQHLPTHLDASGVLDRCQSDLLSGYSTETALLTLVDLLLEVRWTKVRLGGLHGQI